MNSRYFLSNHDLANSILDCQDRIYLRSMLSEARWRLGDDADYYGIPSFKMTSDLMIGSLSENKKACLREVCLRLIEMQASQNTKSTCGCVPQVGRG